MEMPRHQKQQLFCLSLFGLLLLALIFFLIQTAFSAEPVFKTFTLTINSQQVIVNLPDALPSMDTARFGGEDCFNLKICRQQYCLGGPAFLPGHDHIDFVFTDKGVVFALIWIRTLKAEYVVWKYVGGVPILSSIDEIKAIILGDKKLKETLI